MIKFNGFTDKQKNIISRPIKRLVVLNGAVRSGKTFISYFMILDLIREFGVNARGIILGKTLGMVEENILMPMRELFGAYVGDIKAESSGNRYVKIFGCKVRCVGANDKSSEGKIRGATYSWAICDETATYPQNVFDMLMSRLSEPNAKCICTTNPDNPNHWFKVKYLDNKNIEIEVYNFTIDDNPTLTSGYVNNLKKMYEGTELYDRLILGQWVSSSGSIYKKFIADKDKYVVDSVNKDEYVDYAIGIDFGENRSATTFVLVGLERGARGIAVLECERITKHGDTKLLQAQFIEFVRKCFSNGWRPSNAYYDNAQSTLGRSLESAAASSGLPLRVQECTKDVITERINLTIVLMGACRFKVLRRCEEMIKALQEATWDASKKDKEERLDIVSPNNPVDMLDSMEYAFQRWSELLLKVALYGG